MERLTNTHCDVCLRRGVQTKVRTICKECREFLCKDTHLLHKLSMDHSLIDLDPPGEEPRSTSVDELAYDFLEKAAVSETTVLYRAQVAVENGARSKKQTALTQKREDKPKQKDVSNLKVTKRGVFSVKRADDKENVSVNSILCLDDKVIVVDYYNRKLKLFDHSGKYLSSADLKKSTHGITRVNNDKFATCGGSKKVFLWTGRGQSIISEDETYNVDHVAYGIHYNDTYYSVLHSDDNAVTILDRQGRHVRKILMKEAFGKKITFGCDIHMDRDTHDIYLPCWSPSGVLCMSVEGEAIWFTPLSDAEYTLHGITEIYGSLCIADCDNQCLHLMSKTGQYIRQLLQKKDLDAKPTWISYNEIKQTLYVSYVIASFRTGIISVYSLQ